VCQIDNSLRSRFRSSLLSIRSGPVAPVRRITLTAFLTSVGKKNPKFGRQLHLSKPNRFNRRSHHLFGDEFKPSSFVCYTSEKISATKWAFSWFVTTTVPSDLRGRKGGSTVLDEFRNPPQFVLMTLM
jgi:hypothetical protein